MIQIVHKDRVVAQVDTVEQAVKLIQLLNTPERASIVEPPSLSFEEQLRTLGHLVEDEALVGTTHRSVDCGPLYIVQSVHAGYATIEYIESGEKATKAIEAIRQDDPLP